MLNSLDRTVPNHLHQHALGPNGDGTITPACIQAAMSGLPPGKSPGSDGLPYEVYIALADLLILPMVDAFNEAFQAGGAGNLAPSQRTGIVTLLHKGEGKPVDELSSFRPITLLNCDYKILARVLVHRLTPLADAVVDSTQTAFLPGRWIGDNILSHLEEIDYCRQEGQSGCILFLDFSQAYDRLSRQWLDQCMSKMGFPAIAIQWVNLLLRGTQVKAKYHGYCTPLMQVPTGLAQGSPLSPLLWVLASQPLSSRLRQLQQTAQIGAIPLPNGTPAPPCHQHADDTTLHTDTAESAAVAITQAVQPFAVASNSKLNLSKSHDDEDVTWDRREIHIQQQAGAVLVTTKKFPEITIIKRHPGWQRASQETCEGERSPVPAWTNHSNSLCIQQRAEGETPKPPLLGYKKARCTFQAPLPTRDPCGVRPLPPLRPWTIP